MSSTKQYCTFSIGDHYFGVDVREVQEVIRYQKMTRVPLSPPDVAGLINLRGQIVTAIDVRQRLAMEARNAGELPMNVVVRNEDSAVSLLVDKIGDVVDADPQSFEIVPETLSGVARELLSGVYKMKNQLLLVLDVSKTVNHA